MDIESKKQPNSLSRRKFFGLAAVAGTSLFLSTTEARAQNRPPHIIYIHGWQGAWKGEGIRRHQRDGSWLDLVKDYVGERGLSSKFPDFPGDENPDAEVWVSQLGNEVRAARNEGKNSLLLGFSLGSRVPLLLIDACLRSEGGFSPKLLYNIMGIVLVAPLSNDVANSQRRGGAYANFFTHKVDTEGIARIIPGRKIIHSRTDPNVPFEHGEQLARELSADLIEGGTGHFSSREDGALVTSALEEVIKSYNNIT